MQVGQFNCDFTNPRLLSNNCFFWNASSATCQDSGVNLEFDEGFRHQNLGGPWSPLWTGAAGMELRAVAQGNALANDNPPIYFSTNQGNVNCVGSACQPPYFSGQWTNNGISGAVNPADGTPFLAYTCRYFSNDTCNGTSFIEFYNVANGFICSENGSYNPDWSLAMPAVTFFNGKLWIAWRGGTYEQQGSINVASIDPCQLGGNCVTGDFSLSADPTSAKVHVYDQVEYTINVTALNGFNSTVGLSVFVMGPNGLSYNLWPANITGSGSATLSVSTTEPGDFYITITGQSGTLSHQTGVLYEALDPKKKPPK